jgi:hypothetical protein
MQRFGLRDDQWERIKDFLPGREGHVGGTAADNRLFVDAVPDLPIPAHRRCDRQAALPSCIIAGEAVACGEDGIANFERIRYRRHDAGIVLYSFDLIELDGDDLRRNPLMVL